MAGQLNLQQDSVLNVQQHSANLMSQATTMVHVWLCATNAQSKSYTKILGICSNRGQKLQGTKRPPMQKLAGQLQTDFQNAKQGSLRSASGWKNYVERTLSFSLSLSLSLSLAFLLSLSLYIYIYIKPIYQIGLGYLILLTVLQPNRIKGKQKTSY